MGNLSIILNIFTILLVCALWYVTYLAFSTRVNTNETALQTLKRVLMGEPEVPDVTAVAFIGQDWSETPCNDSLFGQGVQSTYLVEADKQDGLLEFMDGGTPIKYGTESTVSKQRRTAFASMTLAQQKSTEMALTSLPANA